MTKTTLQLVIGNKNYSSWSLRAWLMLKQVGLEFEEIRIPLYQPQTRQQLAHYSPSGKVPVLIHETLVIWESIAIGEYIAELVPDRLLPVDPAIRAIARAVSAEMHAGFLPLRMQLPMDCRTRHSDWCITPEVQQNIDRITAIWHQCRQQGKRTAANGDLLFGQFSLADAMFAPVVSRFVTYGVRLDPISQAYMDAVLSLPAMQTWLTAAEAEAETIPDSILFPS